MTQLPATQDTILRAAAEGEGAFVAPRSWKTVAALVTKGLLTSTPVAEGGSHVVITEAGRAAIGLETSPREGQPTSDAVSPIADPASSLKGKIGVLVAMLRQPNGAAIGALTKATGWQAHSVRGAISGSVKKTLGLTVTSENVDGIRFYRIIEAVA